LRCQVSENTNWLRRNHQGTIDDPGTKTGQQSMNIFYILRKFLQWYWAWIINSSQDCSNLAWDNLITLQVQVDKENSMEFLLDSVYYLYNYYMICALLFYTHHMTLSYDMTLWYLDMWLWCVTLVMWHFPTLLPCVVSPNKKRKRKEKKHK